MTMFGRSAAYSDGARDRANGFKRNSAVAISAEDRRDYWDGWNDTDREYRRQVAFDVARAERANAITKYHRP